MLAVLPQGTTNFAPLNTAIDGDRDYRDLTGLGRCNCGYQGLDAVEGRGTMLLIIGGVLAAWALWATATPHQPMAEW